jgi:hypothetical protein
MIVPIKRIRSIMPHEHPHSSSSHVQNQVPKKGRLNYVTTEEAYVDGQVIVGKLNINYVLA